MLAEEDNVWFYEAIAIGIDAAWDLVILDRVSHAISWVGCFAFDASLSALCESHSRLKCVGLSYVAKLPCASIIDSPGTPASRSRQSMFCVNSFNRRPFLCSRAINICVIVGRNFPGYSSWASM